MEMNYTPKQIVLELDKYIVGQQDAKKMVAIALRNRWRAKQLPEDVREEYVPKNILLIGPTGVGKTEIARRLAKLMKAPFIKVEATKFTEVGYVGRDVDQMIRDLVENAVRMVKEQMIEEQKVKATELANKRLLDILWPKPVKDEGKKFTNPLEMLFNTADKNTVTNDETAIEPEKSDEEKADDAERSQKREEFYNRLVAGMMDDREIEIDVAEAPKSFTGILAGNNADEITSNLQDMLGSMMPNKTKKRHTTVGKAREIYINEEGEKLLDMDAVTEQAVYQAEHEGIVFIDEFDKIASSNQRSGADVSREGVQRDILPIVEGATVNTKYGPIKTEHMLFIAAGAFHVSKPSDLIPELQGRFPIRVELNSLTQEDFKAILTTPEQALLKQYHMLLKADDVTIHFTDESIDKIAELAYRVNNETEDIGARRLHTILEKLLQDISFNAPPESPVDVTITAEMVMERLGTIVQDVDLSNYIL
ncbi:MAG: ATP-dependent protease ATPase subunit HslU [Veillonella sp.]|jgi:ATP-dependent HslUV protease ATP-binding subunit HslU|nr:ATP-dependent protease ATPase subunit HslU [Veillonella sp.]MBP6922584.1 ATP-dependent protease ATPase subunit HslU [Veillonella sp.]